MRSLIPAFLIGLMATGAIAQVAPEPRPTRPNFNPPTRLGVSPREFEQRLDGRIREQNQQNGGVTDDQAALIDRVWPLVAEGRCNQARQMARVEGDRALSRRIGQVCVEGRPTAAPAAPE